MVQHSVTGYSRILLIDDDSCLIPFHNAIIVITTVVILTQL